MPKHTDAAFQKCINPDCGAEFILERSKGLRMTKKTAKHLSIHPTKYTISSEDMQNGVTGLCED